MIGAFGAWKAYSATECVQRVSQKQRLAQIPCQGAPANNHVSCLTSWGTSVVLVQQIFHCGYGKMIEYCDGIYLSEIGYSQRVPSDFGTRTIGEAQGLSLSSMPSSSKSSNSFFRISCFKGCRRYGVQQIGLCQELTRYGVHLGWFPRNVRKYVRELSQEVF